MIADISTASFKNHRVKRSLFIDVSRFRLRVTRLTANVH
ncbi:hypothetical protein NSU_4758 [Novosphingobium pentaromativorans US6-1]|uniref:Uncharacterized protein n=1 Tax=Novosphingobium pentaromativorans US6-1 TaxID=1088721 RepID=G6EK87_9SPHN|nr:hypothetical protein NSU_4758 [Novosphingobium pentaromativorans US6-1]